MKARTAAAVAILAVSLAGCSSGSMNVGEEAKGSGKMIVDKRVPAGEFDCITFAVPSACKVVCGSEASVTITADDNVAPLVKMSVENKCLNITMDKEGRRIKPSKEMTVLVTAPVVSHLTLAGAGNMDVAGLKEDSFELSVTGAGNVLASGEVKDVKLNISGAGDANLANLKAQDVNATISGAGNAEVDATQSMTAIISGAGNIRVKGHPGKVEKHISGVGAVTMID